MKRLCRALALTICAVMLLSTLTVAADSGGKTILTLEEAKKIALKNNTQYKLQESYIQEKLEDYRDIADKTTISNKGSSVVDKISNRINNKLAVDSAYNAVELEIFNKNDIKRASDYKVTNAYYNVMKAKYSLDSKNRTMELSRKDLEIGEIQFTLGLITKTTLSQLENSYKASQATYSSAFSDFENSVSALSKEIGKTLDVSEDDIDMTIGIPDTTSLDLEKLKADNLKNNPSFFNIINTLELAEYKQLMVEQEYEDYEESVSRISENIENQFNDLKYKANRDYEDTKYAYDEALKDLELSLKSQLAAITTMQESITNIRKSFDNTITTHEQNKTKYGLGLISRNEFEKSEFAIKDVQNQLSTAIVNLNTQYLALTQYSYTPEK